MKKALLLVITTLSLQAQAHFQIGTYDGKTYEGQDCSFTIHAVNFENNQHHPLNERVEMTLHFLGDRKVMMSHIPQVDNVQKLVRPKPMTLSAVWTNATGAESVELMMNENGPVQMIHTLDNYKDRSQSDQNVCMNLQFRK